MMMMFLNAKMFNKKDHDVHQAAVEMEKEVIEAIEEFVTTEKNLTQNCSQASTPIQSTSGKTFSSTAEYGAGHAYFVELK